MSIAIGLAAESTQPRSATKRSRRRAASGGASPLLLHTPPLVFSNIASLIPIKLSSTNYMLWKSLFEPILHGHKLMHLIDGSTPFPITSDSPFYEKDQMLLSWINAILSESALPYIVGVSSAKAAWDLLKTRYASATPAHVMSLKRQLSRIKKGSQSMIDYIQQFKIISDQLVACGSTFSSSVRIRAQSTALPLEELHTLLICEELALADESPNEQSTAYVAYRPNSPNSGRGNSGRGNFGRGNSSYRGVIVKAVGGKPNGALQILLIMAIHRLPLQILLATLYVINVRYVVELAISPLTATTEWTKLIKGIIHLRS
ncbi:hypothetical protein NE237_018089 [Protea cynaroides]|uniref:Retrotransposon Copia-like N-terminal domain-containing protein n=1 Tax=Protea cynaroides TaxID=273540 RepID=A0A9Q0QNN2_9MAGN|nr:hypothetical protein NE237_018089 [Protea cynaroides]